MSGYNTGKILCLDFDGTLNSFTSGWQGADVIPDPPVEGALEFLAQADLHFEVHIFSSRSHQEGGINAMRQWLIDAYEEHWGYVPDFLREIHFPTEKPPAVVTLDDRAIQFNGPGSWPSMDHLLSFQPWNKR